MSENGIICVNKSGTGITSCYRTECRCEAEDWINLATTLHHYKSILAFHTQRAAQQQRNHCLMSSSSVAAAAILAARIVTRQITAEVTIILSALKPR